jgi:hypothetical protein
MASDRHVARYASALIQAGLFVWVGGMVAGLLELAMWADNQYWPFATLTDLVGTCTACDSGPAAPLTSWLWSQPLWLLVGCAGLALMLLGMALRPED